MNEVPQDDAKKTKIDAEAAWKRLSKAKRIRVAKGKKVVDFKPDKSNREEILKAVMGRSGNLRAPTWQLGSDYVVGFNAELYEEMFGG